MESWSKNRTSLLITGVFIAVSGVEAESLESWYAWFLSFLPQWFMIPTRIQIRDSRRLLIITYWLTDFLRGNLVSFCILWCSNFCFIQTWYHHSFCLGMELFCNWTLSTRLLEKQAYCQPRMHELYRGVLEHVPSENFLKIGLSETPYPAFPGSNAINSYVYLVELFSESRYSWFPSRRTKIITLCKLECAICQIVCLHCSSPGNLTGRINEVIL